MWEQERPIPGTAPGRGRRRADAGGPRPSGRSAHLSSAQVAHKQGVFPCCLYLPIMWLSFFKIDYPVLHNKSSSYWPTSKNYLKFQPLMEFYRLVANYHLFLPRSLGSAFS